MSNFFESVKAMFGVGDPENPVIVGERRVAGVFPKLEPGVDGVGMTVRVQPDTLVYKKLQERGFTGVDNNRDNNGRVKMVYTGNGSSNEHGLSQPERLLRRFRQVEREVVSEAGTIARSIDYHVNNGLPVPKIILGGDFPREGKYRHFVVEDSGWVREAGQKDLQDAIDRGEWLPQGVDLG